MEKQQCLLDTDCPARLICTINAPWNPKSDKGYCECAMTYGWDDISSNCTTLSEGFYVQLAANILFTLYLIFIFLFLLYDFVLMLRKTNIRRSSALAVTLQLILFSISLACVGSILELEDSLYPGRYGMIDNFKVSLTWRETWAMQFIASFSCVFGCLNLSISWTEIAMKTKQLVKSSHMTMLTRYSFALRGSQLVFFILVALVSIFILFDFLVLVGGMIALIAIVSFTYGSNMLVRLLEETTAAPESHYAHLTSNIKKTSKGLVIALGGLFGLSIVGTIYRIFYVHSTRVDHAESVVNRPLIYLFYFERMFAYHTYTVLVSYLHDTVTRNARHSKGKSSKRLNSTPGLTRTHAPTTSRVKDSSDMKKDDVIHSDDMSVHKGTNGPLAIVPVTLAPIPSLDESRNSSQLS